MAKIDKTDLDNIKIISKEAKLKNITSVKIKKGNYEIEISSISDLSNKKVVQFNETKTNKEINQKPKEELKKENIVKSPMVGVAYLSADPSLSWTEITSPLSFKFEYPGKGIKIGLNPGLLLIA